MATKIATYLNNKAAAVEGNHMKWTIALTIGLAVTMLGLNSASAQTRYPMTCRGGAGYYLDIYKDTSTRFGPNYPLLTNQVILWFKHGTNPAHQGLLNPGECTWADRGMAQGEPVALCMTGVKLTVDLQTNSTGKWSFGWFTQTGSNPPHVRNVLTGLVSSNQYQTFWVYNDLKGCMRF
jgi:hypothetical protein